MQLTSSIQFIFENEKAQNEESKEEDLMFSPEFHNQTAPTKQNTAFDDKSRDN
jgi:hypothetical protein